MHTYIGVGGAGACVTRGHTYKNSDKAVGIRAKVLTKLGEFK